MQQLLFSDTLSRNTCSVQNYHESADEWTYVAAKHADMCGGTAHKLFQVLHHFLHPGSASSCSAQRCHMRAVTPSNVLLPCCHRAVSLVLAIMSCVLYSINWLQWQLLFCQTLKASISSQSMGLNWCAGWAQLEHYPWQERCL